MKQKKKRLPRTSFLFSLPLPFLYLSFILGVEKPRGRERERGGGREGTVVKYFLIYWHSSSLFFFFAYSVMQHVGSPMLVVALLFFLLRETNARTGNLSPHTKQKNDGQEKKKYARKLFFFSRSRFFFPGYAFFDEMPYDCFVVLRCAASNPFFLLLFFSFFFFFDEWCHPGVKVRKEEEKSNKQTIHN